MNPPLAMHANIRKIFLKTCSEKGIRQNILSDNLYSLNISLHPCSGNWSQKTKLKHNHLIKNTPKYNKGLFVHHVIKILFFIKLSTFTTFFFHLYS